MRRFQVLKMTVGVVLLLLIAGCATKTAVTQTPKPDTLCAGGKGFYDPKDILY